MNIDQCHGLESHLNQNLNQNFLMRARQLSGNDPWCDTNLTYFKKYAKLVSSLVPSLFQDWHLPYLSRVTVQFPCFTYWLESKVTESSQLTGVQNCPDIYCAISINSACATIKSWNLSLFTLETPRDSRPVFRDLGTNQNLFDLDNFKIFAFLGQHTEGSNLGGGISLVGDGRKTTPGGSRPVQVNTTGTNEPLRHKRRHTTSGCYSGRGNGNSRYKRFTVYRACAINLWITLTYLNYFSPCRNWNNGAW